VVNVGSFKNGVGYGKWVYIDGWSEAVIEYIRSLEELSVD
jgi:60 kDa SS-A/Ro ribonucleoprotein